MACDVLKQAFRTANPAINQMRYDLNTAILEAVAEKDGTVYNVARCQVWCNASFLVIQLPSGRRLLYAAPILKQEDTLTVPAIKSYLDTLEPYARTAISLHVHDEIGIDVPKGSYSEERLLSVMKTKEPWMTGLPVSADTWRHERYGKR